MRAPSSFARRLAGVVATLAALGACTEDVESGAACPALCPNEALATRDTVLEPVVLDTTLAGFPGLGGEGALPIATRGDTLVTRGVLRFDGLPTGFTPAGATAETPYAQLESATLVLPVDSAATLATAGLTVEAYDVDTDAADTTSAALLPLFRADRRLGSVSFANRAAVGDTVRVPFDPGVVLARIASRGRFRVGLLVRGGGGAQLNVVASNRAGDDAARLRLRVPGDTVARDVRLTSTSPAAPPGLASDLRDFLLVARAPAPPAPTRLAAGGVYGTRSLLQFAVPPSILDSATVVRATLELTQAPNREAAQAAAPTAVYVQPVVAGAALGDTLPSGALRDPLRVASLLCEPQVLATDGAIYCPTTPSVTLASQYRLDSLVRAPRDSGVVRIEIGTLVRIWQLPNTAASARAIVLRVPLRASGSFDAQEGGQVLLFSKEAPAAVRPRLRITYVTRSSYALP